MTDLQSYNIDYISTNQAPKQSNYRFVIFFLYTGMSILNHLLLSMFLSIGNFINQIFSIGVLLGYPVGLCLSIWIGSKKGMRTFMLIATGMTVISWWIAYYGICNSYAGACGFALFFMGTAWTFFMIPPKMTSLWFPTNERIWATSAYFMLRILFNNLGESIVLSMQIPPYQQQHNINVEELVNAFEVIAIISTIIGIMVFVLFKNLPSPFPSKSSEFNHENISSCSHICEKNFMFIFLGLVPISVNVIFDIFQFSFFIQYGEMALYSNSFYFACSGIVFFTFYVKKTGKFRIPLFVASIGYLLSGTFWVYNQDYYLYCILIFFTAPILPLGLEFLAESVFPASPCAACALLLPTGYALILFCINFPILMVVLVIVSLFLLFNSQEKLNRSNYDKVEDGDQSSRLNL